MLSILYNNKVYINNFFPKNFFIFINSPASNSNEVNFSTFLSENKLNENYKKNYIKRLTEKKG